MGKVFGKTGKTAALPKFSDMLTLFQLGGGGGRLHPPIGFVSPKKNPDYATKLLIENKTANGSSLQFMQIEITTNIFAVHSAHSVAPPQLY